MPISLHSSGCSHSLHPSLLTLGRNSNRRFSKRRSAWLLMIAGLTNYSEPLRLICGLVTLQNPLTLRFAPHLPRIKTPDVSTSHEIPLLNEYAMIVSAKATSAAQSMDGNIANTIIVQGVGDVCKGVTTSPIRTKRQ